MKVQIVTLLQLVLLSNLSVCWSFSPGGTLPSSRLSGFRTSVNTAPLRNVVSPTSLFGPKRQPSRLPLRMSETRGAVAEKIQEAKKLANEAAKALAVAKESEAKAAELRGKSGGRVFAADRRSEIRTKELLGSIGGALYKSWTGVLRGRPGKKEDPLGLAGAISPDEQLAVAKELFERLDVDGSGGVDKQELKDGLSEVLRFVADDDEVEKMLREADENGDGTIRMDEFVKVLDLFRSQIQAEAMEEEERMARVARTAATASPSISQETIETALGATSLVGDAAGSGSALDALKTNGSVRKWSSFQPTYRPVGAEKMAAVTGMKQVDKALGLQVDALTRLRYQGVGVLGLTGGVALLVAAFLPFRSENLALYGYGTLGINMLTSLFAGPIDNFLQNRQRARSDPSGDRWTQREAGRLVAAYLCGVPVASIEGTPVEVTPFNRRSGNLPDRRELRKTLTADGTLPNGLSDREAQVQAVIQMAGLVAEYRRFGEATLGFRLFRELDSQLQLAERPLDPQEKEDLARFGVTTAYSLLANHDEAVVRVAQGLRKGHGMPQLIAAIETAGSS